MITVKQALKISAIIDKIDLKIKNPKQFSEEEVGADALMQLVRNAHKVETDLYELIASMKKITPQEAEDVDLISFFKELAGDAGLLDFLKSAVKSKAQG